MKIGQPFLSHEEFSAALKRRVEEAWRRERVGVRVQKKPPRVENDGTQSS